MRIALAALAALLIASSSAADSLYSLRGRGESIPSSKADARAMGGAEAAAGRATVTGNPASLATADRATFYGTYETEWIHVEEGDGVLEKYSSLIPNLVIAYPLPGRFVFGTGFLVDRRSGAEVTRSATTSGGQAYQQRFEVSGNLLRIPALVAKRFRETDIGLGVDVLLMNQERRWQNDFGTGFADSDDLFTSSHWGVAWNAGVRQPIGSRLTAGGWLSYPSKLSGSVRYENDDPGDASDDLELDAGAEIAPRYGLGIEARLGENVRAVVDWVHESWTGVQPADPGDLYVNVNRFAGGVEWEPRSGRLRWPLRAGYRTELLHVRDSEGRRVREQVVTVGSGFGVAGGRGEIDWFLESGRRGDTDEADFYEKFFRFGLTLTGVEQWSRRRPPEPDEDW